MSTKAAIIASVGIVVGAIVLGLIALFLAVDPRAANANARAQMLGQGMAMVCLVPLAVIWILWAGKFRAERDKKLQTRQGKPKKKRPE